MGLGIWLVMAGALFGVSARAEVGSLSVGTTRGFWVAPKQTLPASFRRITAMLVSAGPSANVYLEAGLSFPPSSLPIIEDQLERAAPVGAAIPGVGVIALEQKIFGPLPAVNGKESKLTILITDLDGAANGGPDGFFRALDRGTESEAKAAGGHSNEANILYVNGFRGSAQNTTGAVVRGLEQLLTYREVSPVANWLNGVLEEGALLACGIKQAQNSLQSLTSQPYLYSLLDPVSGQSGLRAAFAAYLLDQGQSTDMLSTLANLALPGRSAVETAVLREAGKNMPFDLLYGDFLNYLFNLAGNGQVFPSILSPRGLTLPALKPYEALRTIPALVEGEIAPYSFSVIDLPGQLPPSAVITVDAERTGTPRPDGSLPCSESASVLWKPMGLTRIAVYAVGCEPKDANDVLHFRLSVLDKPFQQERRNSTILP